MVKASGKIADAIPYSRLVILKGGMDPSNLTVPDAFDQEVLGFLKEK